MKTFSRILAVVAVLAIAGIGAAFAASSPELHHLATNVGLQVSSADLGVATAMAFGGATVSSFTEGNYAGEHLVSEASGTRSREVITIASGQDLVAGQVLGKIRGATSSAALGTNTGNGAMGTVTAGAGALEGDYKLTIIEPGSNVGNFVVEDPLGRIIGHGTVASAFTGGGLSFTLADGGTDFVAGDSFTITVAAGTKYAAHDQDATDGSEIAAAVLFDACDASAADTSAVAHVRDCEVVAAKLTWQSDIDAGEKTAALAQLAALGIIAR